LEILIFKVNCGWVVHLEEMSGIVRCVLSPAGFDNILKTNQRQKYKGHNIFAQTN